ncbi:MAG: YebC/PmpR family DNA-binding transcriptional regulator [Patescibacteria group bacterium]|nr:YebC/PmpR family DNA-binding transcriptional regulator [Patescibacteria group bacterium]MDE2588448.1 YebC/PmpR family DNA-binding transcriptional regulator [Patescibacteria group bacterium]
MSGHSKWAQIKRQKGTNDAKRGLAFTKLSAAITIAVKQGGGIGDPNQNFHLRLAVDAARAQNMPKENIERAIARAAGKDAASMEEAMYEGFGPNGVSIIVEAATDNKNRTTGDVNNVFNKNGGTMGQPGSVSYQFKQMGRIIVEKNGKTLDDIFLLAADAGAEDVEDVDNEVFVYTHPGSLNKVREALMAAGLTVKEVELMWKPLTIITVDAEETQQKVISLLDKLEELDDVQKVYSNFDIQ